MATEITYNGSVLASLSAGQSATMACNGKKMASDIVVAFDAAGTITYNGTETAVSAGQTATMACNGKKMLSDVMVDVMDEVIVSTFRIIMASSAILTDVATGETVGTGSGVTLEHNKIYKYQPTSSYYKYVTIKDANGELHAVAAGTSPTAPEEWEASDIGNVFSAITSTSLTSYGKVTTYYFRVKSPA